MEYMYHAMAVTEADGKVAIDVILPGTAGATRRLDVADPRIVESNLTREWIITSEKIPGSWPGTDPNEEVYG